MKNNSACVYMENSSQLTHVSDVTPGFLVAFHFDKLEFPLGCFLRSLFARNWPCCSEEKRQDVFKQDKV
jgi:hypothetical protein